MEAKKALTNAVKLKSKAINLNALYLAVIATLGAYGVELKPELVALGSMVLNIVLRMITDRPLSEK